MNEPDVNSEFRLVGIHAHWHAANEDGQCSDCYARGAEDALRLSRYSDGDLLAFLDMVITEMNARSLEVIR